MLDIWNSDPQTPAAGPGACLGVGGPGMRLGGGHGKGEVGRAPPPKWPSTKVSPGLSCIWTVFNSSPLATPRSCYLPGIEEAALPECLLHRIKVVVFPVWFIVGVLSFIFQNFWHFPEDTETILKRGQLTKASHPNFYCGEDRPPISRNSFNYLTAVKQNRRDRRRLQVFGNRKWHCWRNNGSERKERK